MIHSTLSEYPSSGAGTAVTVRHSSSTHHVRSVRNRSTVSSGARTHFSFAEPDIGSLWDRTLLDRLTLPITRYHE